MARKIDDMRILGKAPAAGTPAIARVGTRRREQRRAPRAGAKPRHGRVRRGSVEGVARHLPSDKQRCRCRRKERWSRSTGPTRRKVVVRLRPRRHSKRRKRCTFLTTAGPRPGYQKKLKQPREGACRRSHRGSESTRYRPRPPQLHAHARHPIRKTPWWQRPRLARAWRHKATTSEGSGHDATCRAV